jgi:hypothetical protein
MKKSLAIFSISLLMALTAQAQLVEYTPDSLLKTKAFKVHLFSPSTGKLTFGYEQHLKNFISIEGKIGFIGVGNDLLDRNPKGVFIKVGPKLKLKPSYASPGTFGTHLLRGAYVRPELVITYFTGEFEDFDLSGPSERTTQNVFSSAILINLGKQHVIGNIMTFDYYFGLGYGFASKNDYLISSYYSHAILSEDSHLAISAGITIGLLIN